jgi:2',3'-cyclic-nucleotide 2'-phosphodiesterase/3'-nucleotidase
MRKNFALNPLLLFVLVQVFPAGPASAKKIAIYHTSDVHGWYSPVLSASGPAGGYAALAALAKKDPLPHILLDSGDWFQGTPEGNLTKGMASITLMNKLGYAASAAGNHDYDYGQENLKKLIGAAKFPVLGANVYNKTTQARVDYLKPYAIIDVGGIRLGIIGLLTEETAVSVLASYIADITFRDKAAEAAVLSPELAKLGVNAVIALTHSGFPRTTSGTPAEDDGNLAIARKAKDVVLVLGGHSHNRLGAGYRDPVSGALLVESGASLAAVSRVELEFSDVDGKFIKAESGFIPLYLRETGSDAEVGETLLPITGKIKNQMDKVAGVLPFDLTRIHGSFQDSTLADWLTDLMREKTGADVAFMNDPGVRGDIFHGSVTVRQVYQVMPFDNTVATMELTGAQIMELMRRNISKDGCLMEVSGINVEYSLDERGETEDLKISRNGKSIDPQAYYRAATSDFLASGGLGGEVFPKGRNRRDTGLVMRQVILDRLGQGRPLVPPETGRIKAAAGTAGER